MQGDEREYERDAVRGARGEWDPERGNERVEC